MPEADFIAVIRLLPAEESGRKSPILVGYRPTFDMGVEGMHNMAMMELIDADRVELGGSAVARIWMLSPEFQEGRLFKGFEFGIYEGWTRIGSGTIKEVLNQALAQRS